MIIVKYENESEAQPIIDSQVALGFHLVAVSNVVEGNFLGFDDRDATPIEQSQSALQLTIINALDEQIVNLQNKLLESEGVI